MKNVKSKSNKNVELKEKLGYAKQDMDVLIQHFDHPAYSPAQCEVMKRVRANLEAAMALLDEVGAAQ